MSSAVHRAAIATPVDMCRPVRSQGGPTPGSLIGGYIQLSRTADAAIMIRIEEPIPTMASQLRSRARPAAGIAGAAVAEPGLAPVALRIRLLLQP